MKITVTKTEMSEQVTIVHLEGALDGSNFECLIDEANKLFKAGVHDLILDMSKLTFISSAGLGALHQVALMFSGKKHSERKESWSAYRWAAYRSIDSDHSQASHQHVKLYSPTIEVMEVLEMIGFTSLFEIYTDLDQAKASFRQPVPAMDVHS